jgi:hypothetical protein
LLGGAKPAAPQKSASTAKALYVDGKLPEAKPGRVDDVKVVK